MPRPRRPWVRPRTAKKGDKEETSQAAKLDSAFTKDVKSSTSYDGLFTVYQDTVSRAHRANLVHTIEEGLDND